ncbi:MAG: hypothetical protein ACPGR8_17150 [Limisphaerales bacterium]
MSDLIWSVDETNAGRFLTLYGTEDTPPTFQPGGDYRVTKHTADGDNTAEVMLMVPRYVYAPVVPYKQSAGHFEYVIRETLNKPLLRSEWHKGHVPTRNNWHMATGTSNAVSVAGDAKHPTSVYVQIGDTFGAATETTPPTATPDWVDMLHTSTPPTTLLPAKRNDSKRGLQKTPAWDIVYDCVKRSLTFRHKENPLPEFKVAFTQRDDGMLFIRYKVPMIAGRTKLWVATSGNVRVVNGTYVDSNLSLPTGVHGVKIFRGGQIGN